ncbi:MAG: methyltransferase domain-containing protein [Chitinophagaceae bacterium]|nr:MAG: methyltransferase domain-containing protein [Chitinophagaceae bacterium]
MRVPVYKRFLSYLYPVCVQRQFSSIHPVLDLYLHRNQWQLVTEDAFYSDGRRYRPLLSAFSRIRQKLTGVKNVLVLGTGLGSAVQILEHMGLHPVYTLVELDSTILNLAIELMPRQQLLRINPVCMDAELFVEESNKSYQLIICDVFLGQVVPDFVPSEVFLRKCRSHLQPGGHFILNYIRQDKLSYDTMRQLMDVVFPEYTLVEFGVNKIFVAGIS